MTFEAFSVLHSLRAPAVGFRITLKNHSFFYAPDVAWIPNRRGAFKGIQFYIGDGATIERNMIRRDRKTGKIFGHANIDHQLGWCHKEHVPKMIITHCGSDIVAHSEKSVEEKIQFLASKRGASAFIATDGLELEL